MRRDIWEPDLKFAGLSLWVYAYERPEAEEYYDANWLLAHARVEADRAVVEVEGAWLRTDDLARFRDELAALRDGSRATAELSCMGPELRLHVSGKHPRVVVEITPDHMTQQHRFELGGVETLAHTLLSLRRVLENFPVKGRPP